MSLTLVNLHKSFGEKILFSNLSYSFNDSGIYAIVGESGTGKTTLLRMICGLDNNYSGSILGAGKENTSFVFQEYRLFDSLSAIENVVMPNGKLNDPNLNYAAASLLSELGFAEKDMKLRPSKLSGGMKQRVSFARGVLRRTPILVLDEPTKELDEETKRKMLAIIEREGKARLVILVSHHPEDLDAISAIKIHIQS